MIIYGTSGAKGLRLQRFAGSQCPHCQAEGTIEGGVYSRYAHVYWIPLFSIGKSAKTVCGACGTEITKKDRSLDIQNRLQDMKSDMKIPFWHFTGLGIVAFLISWGVFQSSQNDADNLSYIQNPLVGDYYEVKVDEGYRLLKVVGVSADSVAIQQSQYIATKLSGLGELKEDYPFEEEQMMLSREYLKSLFEDGEIRDVDR
ncbi:MAG: hypothetical protein AAFQ68_23835 [Bacteroidota bacterium]